MSRDSDRIKFLIDREDDYQKVIDFAIQCRTQYRRAVLHMKRKGIRSYRISYIKSYLFHKKFLSTNKL